MGIYIDLLLVAAITIYIVGISGFTQAWRSGLARMLGIKTLKALPPFDCSKCMTWWTCIIYALCVGQFNLWTIAFSAFLSHMSIPIYQGLIFIREWTNRLINMLMPHDDFEGQMP